MNSVAVLYNDDSMLARGEDQDRIAFLDSRDEAECVCAALAATGFEPVIVPSGSDPAQLAAALGGRHPDLVFNVCESFAGNPCLEYAVAALLELLRIPYTGSPPLALALAQDKVRAKKILSAARLPVPRSVIMEEPGSTIPADLKPPFMVKPRFADASHGISEKSFCESVSAARTQAAYLIETYGHDALVEEFLPGREFNVSVILENKLLPISELTYNLPPGLPPIVTFEAKWKETSPYYVGTPVVCPAQNVDSALEKKIGDSARGAYRALGCRDYARIDMRLDEDGNPCIIEVNPNPCIMPDAGLARSARVAGITYNDFIARIARAALVRGNKM